MPAGELRRAGISVTVLERDTTV
ncbi:hypothetical protein [Nocardia paucivorans]